MCFGSWIGLCAPTKTHQSNSLFSFFDMLILLDLPSKSVSLVLLKCLCFAGFIALKLRHTFVFGCLTHAKTSAKTH
ncbi:hypothetical protein B0181_00020 [Moraxella caviae]|uniref:Uncharacterized protein n=1 Tax=Moraxella caviae TaxID=34060 RepID=A0A1T0ADU6_9GAMM|nr:hypothetical protein B0181_00020 [Moraxella caviae]